MSQEKAPIKIKYGLIELEYDGDSNFLKSDLLELFREISLLNAPPDVGGSPADKNVAKQPGASAYDQSTDTIAKIMGCKTGPDLTAAAVIHLTLVKGIAKISRKQILDPPFCQRPARYALVGTLVCAGWR